MTIEVALHDTAGYKHVTGLVAPGEIATFLDYATKPRSVLAVFCLADNSGGEVYRFAENTVDEDAALQLIALGSLATENRVAVLAPNRPYECDVTSRTRKVIHRVFTHFLND